MKILFKNIRFLLNARENAPEWIAGAEMDFMPIREHSWVLIENDLIHSFGIMSENLPESDSTYDLDGRTVLPGWVDSHTHVVYAGDRAGEFEMRIKGFSYEEIAAKGGGILNSAALLRITSEDELFESAYQRLNDMMSMGTVAAEIKSGYGLDLDSELKMLRIIRRLQKEHPIRIKSTFLGAHAVPPEFKENREGYVEYLIHTVLPAVAEHNLADYIDCFCEKNYFSVEEMERIIRAGAEYGLKAKVHVNQFNVLGAVKAAVKLNALSVDHLEYVSEEDILSLRGSKTMPVALPGCSLFIRIPYTPARQMIDAGLPLALATDYNPGSSPSGNMNLVVSLASIQMNMTSSETIQAATLNGAYAMGLDKELGSITPGKRASFLVTEKIAGPASITYSFGRSLIDQVWIDGQRRYNKHA
jgi:imidazolonepropionase